MKDLKIKNKMNDSHIAAHLQSASAPHLKNHPGGDSVALGL